MTKTINIASFFWFGRFNPLLYWWKIQKKSHQQPLLYMNISPALNSSLPNFWSVKTINDPRYPYQNAMVLLTGRDEGIVSDAIRLRMGSVSWIGGWKGKEFLLRKISESLVVCQEHHYDLSCLVMSFMGRDYKLYSPVLSQVRWYQLCLISNVSKLVENGRLGRNHSSVVKRNLVKSQVVDPLSNYT